jgi:hypothetical protein
MTKPQNASRSGGRELPPAVPETDTKNKVTPNTDMQPEDAGTADSGNDARTNSAERAMKQTSKTSSERGENSARDERGGKARGER